MGITTDRLAAMQNIGTIPGAQDDWRCNTPRSDGASAAANRQHAATERTDTPTSSRRAPKRPRLTPPDDNNTTVRIQIDLAGAKRYMATQRAQRTVVKEGNDRYKARFVGKSHTEILRAYLCQYVNVDPQDASVGWAEVSYKNCPIGTMLMAGGFIEGGYTGTPPSRS